MKAVICVFKNPDTGRECAYKVTIDPKVYRYDWTNSEVYKISTGSESVKTYSIEDWHKPIDVIVHNTCDDEGNLFTLKEKIAHK